MTFRQLCFNYTMIVAYSQLLLLATRAMQHVVLMKIEVVVPVEDIHDVHYPIIVAPNTTAMFEVLFVNSTD